MQNSKLVKLRSLVSLDSAVNFPIIPITPINQKKRVEKNLNSPFLTFSSLLGRYARAG